MVPAAIFAPVMVFAAIWVAVIVPAAIWAAVMVFAAICAAVMARAAIELVPNWNATQADPLHCFSSYPLELSNQRSPVAGLTGAVDWMDTFGPPPDSGTPDAWIDGELGTPLLFRASSRA